MKTRTFLLTWGILAVIANFVALGSNISNRCHAEAKMLLEDAKVDRQKAIASWTGRAVFIYQSKTGGEWQAVAIILDYDPDYFCSDKLKDGMIENGVALPADNRENNVCKCTAFKIPEMFTASVYKNIFLDNNGNVLFLARTYPKDTCPDLIIPALRSRAVKDHPKYGNGWVFIPYDTYTTTYSGDYAGIRCPSTD